MSGENLKAEDFSYIRKYTEKNKINLLKTDNKKTGKYGSRMSHGIKNVSMRF